MSRVFGVADDLPGNADRNGFKDEPETRLLLFQFGLARLRSVMSSIVVTDCFLPVFDRLNIRLLIAAQTTLPFGPQIALLHGVFLNLAADELLRQLH